ncbi:MAG TPA: serpin family protein, partial [Gemmataceae bacterium]|nr:serpin family protein [Gemmataceae bacterium]
MQTRRTAAAFGLVLIIGGAAAVRAGVDPATRPVDADQATTVAAYNRLAFGLYAQLRSSDAGSEPANLLLSSHSAADALAMLYEGARGRTADEIRAALPIPAERERRHRATRELAEFLQDQSPDAQATRKRRAAEAERHGDA